ncbi:hypothetical protein Terro_2594 [Terriglobus roseus DSM 18391]|uniref:Uncharacterized protein n=1 Tax=Terriglobus roseus (strain DSM 18391 / NRRL B-41598 / KBS 63) TaxID=926566 RepID=I3ZGX6_TERRK|nr:hypothetical protein Terro_2230 [Terriglobus roseus DSM 18391]AFL88835.1 hypothetical protein Terro_2594 [Terriglobus roseus DSM 18391]
MKHAQHGSGQQEMKMFRERYDSEACPLGQSQLLTGNNNMQDGSGERPAQVSATECSRAYGSEEVIKA